MKLSQPTRSELRSARHIYYSERYLSFLIKWIAINRAYNEMFPKIRRDKDKVVELGKQMSSRFADVSNLAKELVSLECIGGKRDTKTNWLSPKDDVKWATLWLRRILNLNGSMPSVCNFGACRTTKRILCNSVSFYPVNSQTWQSEGKVAALFRLVYQVRCNVFHGEKRLSGDVQTDRDRKLVELSECILNVCIDWLLNDPVPNQSGARP